VPRVTVVTRKAYGGAYIAMNSSSLGADPGVRLAGRQVAVMGAVAAVRILHRRELAEVPRTLRRRHQVELELAAEHERIAGGIAARGGDRRRRRGLRSPPGSRFAFPSSLEVDPVTLRPL
jgi:acetyl-CoA carboxylase carboxyltransferase component